MTDLFNSDSPINLLPKDGLVYYYGKQFSEVKANEYLKQLLETIHWENDKVIIYGKLIITKRKVAWYGDGDFNYTYSNIARQALLWTPELIILKSIIEEKTKEQYNSCLLNLYHNYPQISICH